MDLGRQILEGTPYPVRAVVAFGLNVRMFPGNRRLAEALKALDFLVDTDIFLTDSAKLADIVLPACTPYERAELIDGPAVRYVQPAIPPRFSSRSDADIICQMAQALDLDDARLRGGYEACCRYLLREVGLTLSDLQLSPLPRKIPGREPYLPGTNLLHGLDTPTGKFELYSERIARHVDRCSYNPLPVHEPAPDAEADAEYPFLLTAGSRIPWAFHSRFHDVPWARALRPTAAADLNPADARARSLRQGDEIVLATPEGEIVLQANLTHMTPPGAVFVYHGYAEADVNSLLHDGQLDRYSGFPTYRSVRCAIRKKG
jgi:anaerobic selenocysteine-containing dehydrogenase